MGVSIRAGIANPSGAHADFMPGFCFFVPQFCGRVFVFASFFFIWPLYYLSFDFRLLITNVPSVTLISSAVREINVIT